MKMRKIIISNFPNFHYEILESVIQKYDKIIGLKLETDIIYLNYYREKSFESYIGLKYPNIIIGDCDDYDYSIECTIYDQSSVINDGKHFYISHVVKDDMILNSNIFFLTPLICGEEKRLEDFKKDFPRYKSKTAPFKIYK
jgi:hypothetical protein